MMTTAIQLGLSPIIHPASTSRRNAFITVVKAAEFRDFDDHTVRHDLTLNWALFF